MKLAKNIRAFGGSTEFYISFLIALVINIIYIYVYNIFLNWSMILHPYCDQVSFSFKGEQDKTHVTWWNWVYFLLWFHFLFSLKNFKPGHVSVA